MGGGVMGEGTMEGGVMGGGVMQSLLCTMCGARFICVTCWVKGGEMCAGMLTGGLHGIGAIKNEI